MTFLGGRDETDGTNRQTNRHTDRQTFLRKYYFRLAYFSVSPNFHCSYFKSGWSNKSEPDLNIPSIVGHGRHKGAMATLGLSDSYVGRQAQTLQGILNIRQPFKQGCVQHWDDLELLWDHVWKQELKRMRVSSSSFIFLVGY